NGKPIDIKTNSTGSEHKIENQNQVKQKFTLGNETEKGFFAYSTRAQYSHSEYGTVNASYSCRGDGAVQTFFSFEHEDSITYDPSIGVETDDGSTDTNAIGDLSLLLLGVTAIFVTTLAVTRFRKRN
ncbi:MAG: hypothetical protein ACTSQE_13030, partial [Candidatus Heimdallarchaeaceae archaeon]